MSEAMDPTFGGVIGRTVRESTPWWPAATTAPHGAPNVIVVVLDDVGWAQLGCYGSAIETPVMDALAAGGLRYTNFHATPLCSPTRASLLTGRNHHSVGMGCITEFRTGFPGYQGRITRRAATLAEMLTTQGYNAFAVGKWHLVPGEETSAAGPYRDWPLGRGFERYYGFLQADTDQWNPDLVEDNHHVEPPRSPGEGYHLTEDLIDHAIGFVRDQRAANVAKPFFLYVAFGACHAPHHAPAAFIDKYRGRFDHGWDVERERVLARQKATGLVPGDTVLPPRNDNVRPWSELPESERRLYARMQEVFAGFLDHTDHHLGRLVRQLADLDALDDTVILLVSDNGASQEGGRFGSVNEFHAFNLEPAQLEENLAMIDALGGPLTFNHYPVGWAMAGNTPLKRYKQNAHGGGVRVPLIAHWPRGIRERGGLRHQFHHVSDLVPTVLETIGLAAPSTHAGVAQIPIEGTSLRYTFDAPAAPTRKTVQYFEMLGHRAVWHDGWKAVAYHRPRADFDQDVWELYHVERDVSESNDLAARHPDKLREMVERWWTEAGRYQVLPIDDRMAERMHLDSARREPRRASYVYYPGMATVPQETAADTRNRSHAIIAHVVIPHGGAEGVLLAMGSRFGGYSLFVKDRRLVYEYNFLNRERFVVTSSRDVPAGEVMLGVAFTRTGRLQGTAVLTIDGAPVGEAKIGRTIPARYSFSGGLDCGQDCGAPVSEAYASPFSFTGTIRKVVVTLAPDDAPDPTADARAALGRE
jgi:arylsulfatase